MNSRLLITTIIFQVFSFGVVLSQGKHKIEWLPLVSEKLSENHPVNILRFEGASYIGGSDQLPRKVINVPLSLTDTLLDIDILVVSSELVDAVEKDALEGVLISEKPNFTWIEITISAKKYLRIELLPLYKSGSSINKITEFELSFKRNTKSIAQKRSIRSSRATTSVLSGGTWYKIAIIEDGVYKINQDFVKKLGIDPKQVNLNSLRVYGNGGGMLPEDNVSFRNDDLVENPIWLNNSSITSISGNDYALFYAQGPHEWKRSTNGYTYTHNVYSDTNYYFITFDGGIGSPKRIISEMAGSSSNATVLSTFNDYASHELDLSNLISSGRQWVGESFGVKPTQYIEFEFPNISTSLNAEVKAEFMVRSVNSNSTIDVSVNGLGSVSKVGGNVGSYYLDAYARRIEAVISGNPSSGKLGVSMTFTGANSTSIAWLDRIVVNCSRRLSFFGGQMKFQNLSQLTGSGDYRFQVENVAPNTKIWNITNDLNPINQNYDLNSGTASFIKPNSIVNEFVVFTDDKAYVPEWGGKIANQNLHAFADIYPDMIIYSPPIFIDYAEEVADFHRENDNMIVEVIDVNLIYNEFSSGKQDVVALRDFMKMLYDEANGDQTKEPQYLLLFGDASYDYKNRISGNTNFVPIYQYVESYNPIGSIATDDFYSFLDDSYSTVRFGIAQLGIGRFPVKSIRQAAQAVNKLKNYKTQSSLGKWRLELAYIGDDEDGGLHMNQASGLADTVDALYPQYNTNKVLFDLYPQRSTPGGDRYPDVNDLIDDAVQRGALTLNYVGHGGELGWAHERVLEVSQINKWSNINNMPLFVTATCEFSRFDDPKRTSAGEFVFLNPDGGGIGLLTTTRVVYSSPNYALAQAFNQIAFKEVNGEMPRLGDIVRATKVRSENLTDNARAFALLGDPALKLNYPEHEVITASKPDTIGALQVVNIDGEIIDHRTGLLMNDFNGTAYTTVFDKKKKVLTLNNDGEGVKEYKVRNNILFRGKSTVLNGKFSVSFVVPKDINYSYGLGKISYYAENGVVDAGGFDTSVVVGGQVGNPEADQLGPDVDLYMNDTTFVFGGMTNESPTIYARLFDVNGINTSGSGVGHDVAAVLDEDSKNELILNDYYESALNSYQKGTVQYPFKDLSEGKHTLTLRAWDVYNNSGEDVTEFVVSESAELALSHVLNYPNPFSTKTDFYFEHNYPQDDLGVRIQIFTVSGKIVKTIDGFYSTDGFRVGPIPWDGKDDFGDKIGTGVYVYKIQVKATNGEVADKFEKLVILN